MNLSFLKRIPYLWKMYPIQHGFHFDEIVERIFSFALTIHPSKCNCNNAAIRYTNGQKWGALSFLFWILHEVCICICTLYIQKYWAKSYDTGNFNIIVMRQKSWAHGVLNNNGAHLFTIHILQYRHICWINAWIDGCARSIVNWTCNISHTRYANISNWNSNAIRHMNAMVHIWRHFWWEPLLKSILPPSTITTTKATTMRNDAIVAVIVRIFVTKSHNFQLRAFIKFKGKHWTSTLSHECKSEQMFCFLYSFQFQFRFRAKLKFFFDKVMSMGRCMCAWVIGRCTFFVWDDTYH